jgi:hemolysin-activating ACP:hemolysin acyltransferase
MFFGSKKRAAPIENPVPPPIFNSKNGKPPAAPSSTPEAPLPARSTAGPDAAKPQSPEETRRASAAARQATAFAQIVALLMRSPAHKHHTLADLEWLVFPPLLSGQFAVAEARNKDGQAVGPAAALLWASVSPEVDRRLSANLNAPIRLSASEWKSGDILWLVDAVGDARVVEAILKGLSEKTFKGRAVKMRSRGKDNKVTVTTIGQNA